MRGSGPRNPRFGRTRRGIQSSSRPKFFGLGGDFDGGPEFPGVKLPKERWTRTRTGLGNRGVKFNWNIVFGRDARRIVDLGCGNGRYIISSAIARPEFDHLGIELVPPAVRLGSLRAGQRGLTNCKLAWGDATEFITERCEAGSIDEVHLYHPQPYYDASKTARRQLSPEVLLSIFNALRPGGIFVFQTDNPAFFEYARATVPQLFDWREPEGTWPDAPEGRTLREIVARSKGLLIFRAEARKRPISGEAAAEIAARMPAPAFDANRPGYGDGG
ncbi:MAG: methyltransferase domain-containing protein [Planctomycetes bacterium]|nr:methyltransferase domain-containing protein [Planctomycetota bacterium]